MSLVQPEREQRRDEEDPPADAQQPGHDPGGEAEAHGCERDGHWMSRRTPTTTRSAEKRSEISRRRRRCWSAAPAAAPTAAGSPTRAASETSTWPWAA